jgi:hypothetical protein
MWRSIGARARGAAHEGAGTLCQDAFAHACLGGGIAAIAVADGAGSATYARCGAELVVDRAIRYLRNVGDLLAADPALWSAGVRGAFDAARGALIDFGRAKQIDTRQLATTLQVAVLGETAYAYGRVGDGGGVGRRSGELIALAPAPANVFANETTFVTSPHAEPEIVFETAPLSDCALFTDGLQHLAMHVASWTPHDPFFGPLFAFLRENPDVDFARDSLAAYLGTEKFHQRTDDDRALVIAVRTEDAA